MRRSRSRLGSSARRNVRRARRRSRASDQRPCSGPRPAAKRGAQHAIGLRRAPTVRVPRAGIRRRRTSPAGCSMKLRGIADPGRVEHGSGPQEQQPRRARRRRGRLQPLSERLVDGKKTAAGDVGHPAVASREPASATITSLSRPAVAPDTSGTSVGTSARSEFVGGNDDAQHSLPSVAPGVQGHAARGRFTATRSGSKVHSAAFTGNCSCFVLSDALS